MADSDETDSLSSEAALAPGTSFDVRVTVSSDGNLSLAVI
jgi:hypothetical protein